MVKFLYMVLSFTFYLIKNQKPEQLLYIIIYLYLLYIFIMFIIYMYVFIIYSFIILCIFIVFKYIFQRAYLNYLTAVYI